MEPRVTKRDRKLHLSYELPHRIHCTQIYPVKAANGSTLIIYGHDRGIRLLWRGGKVPKKQRHAPEAQANGGASADVIVIDSDEDVPAKNSRPTGDAATEGEEEEEEELDPDCPYPSIISEIDVDLGSAVLHLATPALSPSIQQASPLFTTHAMVALACAGGQSMVINVPLAPPSDRTIRDLPQYILESRVDLPHNPSIYRSIAMHIHTMSDSYTTEPATMDLLIATISAKLQIFRLPITSDHPPQELHDDTVECRLGCLGKRVDFHPSSHSSQVLVTDVSGAVRIFDPAAQNVAQRPSSRDSALLEQIPNQGLGRWTVAFSTSFINDTSVLPRRKQILDATWILSGRAIIMLLEDGEWGIWDVSGLLQSGKNIREFVLHGYLSSSTTETEQAAPQKKGSSKLAPMTPNTRKSKAEKLFVGPPKVVGVAPAGNISMTQSVLRAGQTDESVLISYEGELYSITSLQQFWQRSNNSSGTLQAAGLVHLKDINLTHEKITSTAQFDANSSSANLGQMNTQRDILVSAEHRLIILQHLRPSTPSKALFQKAAEQPDIRDQRMLDAGELDIGGMDRMLDNLANGDGRPRRVGFAQ